MDLRIFIEPQQGATYDDQLAVAKATEDLGFDAFFRSDHYLAHGRRRRPARPDRLLDHPGRPRARDQRIRLGTLVSSATFRHPGVLAIQVAQVDQMSGGRVELGPRARAGSSAEHAAYGIPFPEKRFGLLEEQLEIVTGPVETPAGEPFSFHGEHYDLTDSPALPKPAQRSIPRDHRRQRRDDARPRWPPGTPPSSTCTSRRRTTSSPQFGGPARGVRGGRPRPARR